MFTLSTTRLLSGSTFQGNRPTRLVRPRAVARRLRARGGVSVEARFSGGPQEDLLYVEGFDLRWFLPYAAIIDLRTVEERAAGGSLPWMLSVPFPEAAATGGAAAGAAFVSAVRAALPRPDLDKVLLACGDGGLGRSEAAARLLLAERFKVAVVVDGAPAYLAVPECLQLQWEQKEPSVVPAGKRKAA